jgi:hypothetical protein
MSDHTVSISLDQTTIDALCASNYYLYGFIGVKSSDLSGLPSVWWSTQDFFKTLTITWALDKIWVFTSSAKSIEPGDQIQIGNKVPISRDQTFIVNNPGGAGKIKNGSSPSGVIDITNSTKTPYNCGITIETPNNQSVDNPIVELPLYGNSMQALVPLAKILLMFSTKKLQLGTLVKTSSGPCIFIDMTSNSKVNVWYDINGGWTWDNQSWASSIAANQDISSVVIKYDSGVLPSQLL